MNILARALLVLALLVPSLASASVTGTATPESRAEATRLLGALDMQALLDKSIDVSIDALVQGQPALAPYRGVMKTFFGKYMSYESLKPQLVEIYAQAFTASELKELGAWYASPTGKKAMQVMPGLMQAGSELGRKQIEAHMPELQKMVMDEGARLKAASGAAAKPAQ
jgi:hypothetical protein